MTGNELQIVSWSGTFRNILDREQAHITLHKNNYLNHRIKKYYPVRWEYETDVPRTIFSVPFFGFVVCGYHKKICCRRRKEVNTKNSKTPKTLDSNSETKLFLLFYGLHIRTFWPGIKLIWWKMKILQIVKQ